MEIDDLFGGIQPRLPRLYPVQCSRKITGRRSPRSTVPSLRGAGEEAHSPAAWGVGGVVEGGRPGSNWIKINDFKRVCIL